MRIHGDDQVSEGFPIGRAAFLATLATGVAGIFLGPRVAGTLSRGIASVVPLPVGPLGAPGTWRIYAVSSPLPHFHADTYELGIAGLVERPRTLGWPAVAALPGADQVTDFHCVTGWSVPGVRWEGVRPATILDLVRPRAEARYVTFLSLEEPYADQISIDQFAATGVMLARRMDGRPLTREHGAPLRLVIPQMYGYKGVKWVNGLRFDAEPGLGFWEQRGYDVDAFVGRSNGFSS